MNYKKAKQILESEEIVTIEEYTEALEVVRTKEEKLTKPKNHQTALKAHQAWLKRNKEQTEFNNQIRKYWRKPS
jgi:hypothetical protein